MIKIRLKQDAYFDSGFLREIDENGNKTIYGWDEWYQAAAEDECGNEYEVFWQIREDYDPEIYCDEESACKWDSPVMVLDESGQNVVSQVVLN